jgi:hypothetical protein
MPMKKFAFILGIVLMAALLVGAGFWLGFGQRSMTEAYSVTALEKSLTEAGIKAMILHNLDSGQVERARGLLRSQLDADIVAIWALGDYSDPRSRKLATNVLARIAAYRSESVSLYTNRTTAVEAEIDAIIASILEQSRKLQTN